MSSSQGWFPNPNDLDTEIFWDGTGWSGDVRSLADSPTKPIDNAVSGDTEALGKRSLRRISGFPFWSKVAVAAIVLGLMTAVVIEVIPAGSEESSRADAVCRQAVLDHKWSNSSADIIQFEMRPGPSPTENNDGWKDFLTSNLEEATIAQRISGFTRVFAKVAGSSAERLRYLPDSYLPDSYVGVGEIIGTDHGTIVRRSFLCGVVLDGTEDGEQPAITFVG